MKKQTKSPLKRKQLRYSGQSIDDEINKITNKYNEYWGTLAYLIGGVILGWIIYYVPQQLAFILLIIVSIFTVFYAIYVAYRTVKFRKNRTHLRQGRNGEKEVANCLDELKKEGVHIIHDVIDEDKTFNIDHVVICPQGVFTIETKTYSKPKKLKKPTAHGATIEYRNNSIIKDGHNMGDKIIKQAQNQARWLKDKLNVPVFPVVVFVGWWVESSKNNNIAVMNHKNIKKYIESLPEKFSVEKSNDISNILYNHVRMSNYD